MGVQGVVELAQLAIHGTHPPSRIEHKNHGLIPLFLKIAADQALPFRARLPIDLRQGIAFLVIAQLVELAAHPYAIFSAPRPFAPPDEPVRAGQNELPAHSWDTPWSIPHRLSDHDVSISPAAIPTADGRERKPHRLSPSTPQDKSPPKTSRPAPRRSKACSPLPRSSAPRHRV